MIRRGAVPSGPVTTLRSAFGNLLVVAGAVAAGAGSAVLVDRALEGWAPLIPLAPAVLVAGVFAWRAMEGLLTFLLFAMFADTVEHWLNLDLLLFDEIALLLLIGVAGVRRHLDTGRMRIGWLEASLLILAFAAVGSSLLNQVPLTTWVPGLLLLLKGIAFFYLVRWLRVSPEQAVVAGTVVLIVASAVGALGFIEWLDPTAFQDVLGLPPYGQARGDVPVIRSIFLHPAQFGWLTAFASLLCYAHFMTRGSWWALALAGALNVGTFLSGRRTPLLGVAAAVGAGLVLASYRHGFRRAVTHIWLPAVVVIVIVAAVAGPSIGRLAAITAFEYRPSIGAAAEIFADHPRAEVIAPVHPRVALYAGSVAVARDHFPLGGGLGRFGSHMSREDYSPLYERYGLDQVALLGPGNALAATDAFWPMVLGETGALGLLGGAAFFVGIGLLLARGAAGAASATQRMVAAGAFFVFIESLVRSATSSVFVAPPIAYFALGAAGLGMAALSTAQTAEAS